MALEKLTDVEDKNLLAGYICTIFGDYSQVSPFLLFNASFMSSTCSRRRVMNQAQELFLLSTKPLAALEMRRDLLHWDHALKLAETLAPDQVPEISLQYAKQLEFRGEYDNALNTYQSCMGALPQDVPPGVDARQVEELRKACIAGITRMHLRTGDLRRGLSMAKESNDRQLCKDAAQILER